VLDIKGNLKQVNTITGEIEQDYGKLSNLKINSMEKIKVYGADYLFFGTGEAEDEKDEEEAGRLTIWRFNKE